MTLSSLHVGAELVEIDPDWRLELQDIARGRNVHNQATENAENLRTWRNLRFRSASEVKIAEALDRAGVLFVPNAWARMDGPTPGARVNQEPDFLVCKDGKCGVLEVDGEPFHPATRSAHEHARDRLFKKHGIRVVERFDATECYRAPDGVVMKFLALLDHA